MKRIKFTFGLMLSMLILGASVVNAQYINYFPHDGLLMVTADVQKCEFYASDVSIEAVYKDYQGNYGYPYGTTNGSAFGFIKKTKGTTGFEDCFAFPYGSGLWGDSPIPANSQRDWYFDDASQQYVPNSPFGAGIPNLFYCLQKSQVQVYNNIKVELKGKLGLDIVPIVKRTIWLGDWETIEDAGQKKNVLLPTGVLISQYLIRDSVWFRPIMDRADGTYTFIFKDQILPLIDKYHGSIFAIFYEITINDEYDTQGTVNYDPPVGKDTPGTPRLMTLAPEAGIKTFPNHLNGPYFVNSYNDFTFRVFSDNPIEVVLKNRYEYVVRQPGGLFWIDNHDGSFDVTIKRVQHDMTIEINSAVPTTATGNEAILADIVWAASGTLFVKAANPGTLSVYSITGQLVNQTAVSGSYSLALPKGLFIVQLNGKAYKVIN